MTYKERRKETCKTMNLAGGDLFYVVSEPGDMTQYNYLAYYHGGGHYHFMPLKSSFKFPQIISIQEIPSSFEGKDLFDRSLCNTPEIVKIAEDNNCNPNTVLECIRTIIDLDVNL